jgi:hypothetical protein
MNNMTCPDKYALCPDCGKDFFPILKLKTAVSSAIFAGLWLKLLPKILSAGRNIS